MIKTPSKETERIAKRMAASGLCSRREAERWIAEGRVQVNGATIDSPALNVSAEDTITVDGKPILTRQAARLWLYHKPVGLLTTHHDPQGRDIVFDHLPSGLPRVISVGRLDMNSEGLLLLTNDGALAETLMSPKTNLKRVYKVRAYGAVLPDQMKRLTSGITVTLEDGSSMRYQPMKVKLKSSEKKDKFRRNHWFEITITEGKNREIRRAFSEVGLEVNRLIRTAYGPYKLGSLPRGDVKEVEQRTFKTYL